MTPATGSSRADVSDARALAAALGGRRRRDRAPRGRVARRPVDRGRRRVPPDERDRDPGPARPRAVVEGEAVRPRLDGRGVRVARRGRAVHARRRPLSPNSPYAASKAASDLLVRAAHHTHGLPAVVTRCSNNYGPNQFPEKLIPLMVTNALEGRELPVYGDGLQVRDWIHVEDHCRGLEAARKRGKPGEVYNLGAGNEWKNIDIVQTHLARAREARDR